MTDASFIRAYSRTVKRVVLSALAIKKRERCLDLAVYSTGDGGGFAPKINMRPVAAESGPVIFRVGDNFLSSSLVDRPNLTREIVTEADSFTAVLAEVQPTFLVMDVEGAETSILASTDDFGMVRAICLEIHPHVTGQDRIEDMMAHLARCGFALRQDLSRKQTVFLERAQQN